MTDNVAERLDIIKKNIEENKQLDKERLVEFKLKYLEWLDNERNIELKYFKEHFEKNQIEDADEAEKFHNQHFYDSQIKIINNVYNCICKILDDCPEVLYRGACDLGETKNLFMHWVDYVPSAPLKDIEEEWIEITSKNDTYKVYKHRRFNHLKKFIDESSKSFCIDFNAVNVYDKFGNLYTDLALVFEVFRLGLVKVEFPYYVHNWFDNSPQYPINIYTDVCGTTNFLKEGQTVTVTKIEELKYHRISTPNRIFKKISECTFGDITNVYESVSSIEAQKLQQD